MAQEEVVDLAQEVHLGAEVAVRAQEGAAQVEAGLQVEVGRRPLQQRVPATPTSKVQGVCCASYVVSRIG